MEQHFYHRGSNGDIIYSLPTIISCGGNAILYLRDEKHLLLLYRLLKLQSYIKEIKMRTQLGKISFIDLSRCLREVATVKREQHLAITHLEAQNKLYDLTQPWLYDIEPNYASDIIINRTAKYHDKEDINWSLLKPFESRCKFVGYEKERKQFVKKYKVDIPFHETKDALELAKVIKGSKLFIGNQSLAFAIAEAMKHPRCLEVYNYYNNCQPHGDSGHTVLTAELIDKYLNEQD